MDYLIKRPMLLCAAVSSVIAVVGFYSKAALIFIGICIIALLFIFLYKRVRAPMIIACGFALITVFSLFLEHSSIDNAAYYSGNICSGEYIVITEPEETDDYYSVTLEVAKSEILKKGTKIDVFYSQGDIEFSDRIYADVTLKAIKDSPFKLMDYSEKIYLNGYMNNAVNTGSKDFVLKNVAAIRKYIKNKVFENYSYNEAATILALITSDDSYFSDRFYGNVKAAGVAHVMVVSGMHLSIIVTFILYFVQKFFYNRRLRALITFFAVLTVITVCGFTMSIIRAGVTYVLLSLALLLDKPNTPSNTLGAAVSLILINNPLAVFSVSFQLSVLSTFGVLAVAVPVTDFVEQKEYIKKKYLLNLFSAVVISISATVMTAPVIIYIFGYISNVFIITNLLVCTPSTVALWLAVLGIIFPPLEKVFFFLSEIIVKYINAVINYFGELPFAVTRLPEWTAYVAVGIIIIILYGLVACKKHINMLKLKEIHNKKIKEGGKRLKWRSFTKKALKKN